MKPIFILMAILLLNFGAVLVFNMNQQNNDNREIVVTHDQALQICNELGKIYNFEAQGTTADEFCTDNQID